MTYATTTAPTNTSALEWIRSTPWDGVHRLDDFFVKHLRILDAEYHSEMAEMFFVSAIAKISGTRRNRRVPSWPIVIAGRQGIGLSSFVRALAPAHCGQLELNHGTPRIISDSDAPWVVEIPEFTPMIQSAAVQEVVVNGGITARAPYARAAEFKPLALIGTTNNLRFSRDDRFSTGRGIYVMRAMTGRIDLDAVRDEVPQIWAEAHRIWETSERARTRGPNPA